MKQTLTSFDVFDTVLTRMVGDPSSVFLFVGYRAVAAGYWRHSFAQFAAARLQAESNARADTHPKEITLHDIYDQLAFSHDLSVQDARACAALEVEVEGALLRAVPAAYGAIDDARRQGHDVAFISDMYLPASVVADWLTRHGLMTVTDRLWISSESGVTKESGELFRHIRTHRAAPVDWRHIGDNAHSDVRVARAVDIQSKAWEACRPTRYERRMESKTSDTAGLSSLLAGASRWVRLNQPAKDAAEVGMRDIAAGVAGPVLWAFVSWVLHTAQREGVRRIWFTARDGQIMLRMAGHIAPRLGINIEMGYLYGGRQVVHLAGLQRIDDRALKWMTGGAGVVSAAALLERVGLTMETASEALRRHGIPLEGPIGWTLAPALEAFFHDTWVQSAVLAEAAVRRDDMRSYFESCGLIDGESCAIVDIGWRGSVLRSIFDVLGHEHAIRHRFLYFGLFGRPPDVPEARMSAFCFDTSGVHRLGVAYDVPALTSVMEVFCQADHAQVVHVERRDGSFVPRLRMPPVSVATLWDVGYFQKCLERYAESVLIEHAIDPWVDLRPLCGVLLRELITTPTSNEAMVLGSVQYVDDQGGTTSQAFARPFDLSDLRCVARDGKLPQKALAWWADGAWALTPPRIRVCLTLLRRMRRAFHI